MTQPLVEYLSKSGYLRTPHLIKAFQAVRRKDFLLSRDAAAANSDYPIPIGHGQTNSQPSTVARMLEWLAPEPGQRVLDVGAGSGWTTALLALAVGSRGAVIGTELVPELMAFGRANLAKYRFPWARIEQAADQLGWAAEAPYDRILVSAAAAELPDELTNQLADGGRLVIPVGSSIEVVDKRGGRLERYSHAGFAFVPLRH